MAKITYVLYDIVYDLEDLDNEDKDLESTLPKELEFDISDGDSNVQYEGADWISDKVGFFVVSFQYRIKEPAE